MPKKDVIIYHLLQGSYNAKIIVSLSLSTSRKKRNTDEEQEAQEEQEQERRKGRPGTAASGVPRPPTLHERTRLADPTTSAPGLPSLPTRPSGQGLDPNNTQILTSFGLALGVAHAEQALGAGPVEAAVLEL